MELKKIGIARTPSGVRSISIQFVGYNIAFQKSGVKFFPFTRRFFATHKTAASN